MCHVSVEPVNDVKNIIYRCVKNFVIHIINMFSKEENIYSDRNIER